MIAQMFILWFTMAALGAVELSNAPSPLNKVLDSTYNEIYNNFTFVTREQWQARSPKEIEILKLPVPYVVIHHSYIPPACYTRATCSQAMRTMQNLHMDDNGWPDIGYNLGVGSDGAAYEGCGWKNVGAHALSYNNISIGICLIGDWRDELPPQDQLRTTKALIETGVRLGYIDPNYKLIGHRQVRNTECPGDALYHEIQKWDHFTPHPSNSKGTGISKEVVPIINTVLVFICVLKQLLYEYLLFA